MTAEAKTTLPEVLQREIWIQTLTHIWMSVEALVSLGAAWTARSPALLGFGGDSAVELLSAAVVLWRFCSPSRGDHAEQQLSFATASAALRADAAESSIVGIWR